MKKYKCGIIDDEQFGRDFIALLLANEFPEIEVIFRADSVNDAKMQLRRCAIDLLFLDIELGDGTAFDLLSALGGTEAEVVFITAYDSYAIQAIRNDAVDYILKPVRTDDFIAAVRKALHKIDSKLHNITNLAHLNLPSLHGFRRVAVIDIIRCEADSNYTMIYLRDNTKILVSKTLQEFEDQLSEYSFCRIHHKHLINLAHFREYIKGKGGLAILSDGTSVNISVRRKNDFLELLKGRHRN